ncbi:MAG: bifunctional 4-hydroxy-2-oxoglutarate aldolase/2-dehydro-3-deoxy-phosphogluconate aldolase, partial [Reichenbachiella sp.]
MARFTRIEVAQQMGATGMVPVFYHKDIEICKKILKACYEGGVRVFEFVNRGDFAHEVFTEL